MNRIRKKIERLTLNQRKDMRKTRKRPNHLMFISTLTDVYYTNFHSLFSPNTLLCVGFVNMLPCNSFDYCYYQNNEEGC